MSILPRTKCRCQCVLNVGILVILVSILHGRDGRVVEVRGIGRQDVSSVLHPGACILNRCSIHPYIMVYNSKGCGIQLLYNTL